MNKYVKSAVVGLVLATLAMGGAAIGAAAGAGKARPVSVGVVDVQKVLEQLSEKIQVDADLQTRTDRLQQEAQDREKKIQDLQKDIEILAAPGSAAHEQKMEEAGNKVAELRAWREVQSQRLQREKATQYANLYRKITDTIGQTAKETGFDIVLFKETQIDMRNLKPEQLGAFIQVRKLLWSSDDLDITDQVIQKMNNDFKNSTTKK